MNKPHLSKLIVSFLYLLLLSIPAFADPDSSTYLPGKYSILKTDSNQSFKVYLAGPKEASRGILLVHEWWGLNKDVEIWTNQFAKAGYRAMAIDLYNGSIATAPKDAKALMNSVKQDEANAKYSAALKVLKASNRKLAVIGWSFGGSQALHASLAEANLVSATVMYYPFGKIITDKKVLSSLKGPILGQFAEHDFAFTPDKVEEFRAAIKDAAKELKVNMYDAKHGFDKLAGKNFNRVAHDLARSKTHKFLDKYLK